MAVAPGGMPELRTCTLPFPNPTLIVVVFCHCWNNGSVSSLLHEPPYTEPYVRWCGRTAGVTPPPTRYNSSPLSVHLIAEETEECSSILQLRRLPRSLLIPRLPT